MAIKPIFPMPIKFPVVNPDTGLLNQDWVRWLNLIYKHIEELETQLAAAEARITALEA